MTVTILEDNTAAVIADLQRDAGDTRRAFAARILEQASANAPVDSGALSVSGYLVDETGSGFSDAAAAAESKNTKVIMAEAPAAERDTTIIAFAVEYALINEFYTGPTNPGAHPFLTPAVEAERPAFEALGGEIT